MGYAERRKDFGRYVGWQSLISEDGWEACETRHTVMLKRVPDHAFSIQTPSGLVTGQAGDYILRDPETGWNTVVPASVATVLFDLAPEGCPLVPPAASAAESASQ